jgi:hypothetical protein
MTDRDPAPAHVRLPEGAVLIHIGPPKTGTTALQASLFDARDALAGQGVHHAGGTRNPTRAVEAAIGKTPLGGDRPRNIREWQALAREISRARGQRVVLSSEFLASADPSAIRAIVNDLGPDRVHVVVTLRPLAKIIPSTWQMVVRSGVRLRFDAWLRHLLPVVGEPGTKRFWFIHRHDELIERWASVVGLDRVTAVVVDDSDRTMLLRIFEQFLGLEPGTLHLVSGASNRSLTLEEAETVRALNVAFTGAGHEASLHARAVSEAAALFQEYRPLPEDHPIRLPDWTLEPIGHRIEEIVAGIRATGVEVLGDLDTLRWLPTPEGSEQDLAPDVPPEDAARLALGVAAVGGLLRQGGRRSAEEVEHAVSGVGNTQLLATVAARTRVAIARGRWTRLPSGKPGRPLTAPEVRAVHAFETLLEREELDEARGVAVVRARVAAHLASFAPEPGWAPVEADAPTGSAGAGADRGPTPPRIPAVVAGRLGIGVLYAVRLADPPGPGRGAGPSLRRRLARRIPGTEPVELSRVRTRDITLALFRRALAALRPRAQRRTRAHRSP